MAYLLPRSVFIHTPKTAGQWVASALGNAGLVTATVGEVHASPDEIRRSITSLEGRFLFTFVRHPLLWYQSMWAHRTDEAWEPIDDPEWFSPRWIQFWAEFTEHCRSSRFEGFVRKCVEYYPQGFVSDLFESYTSGCSFVGKQETLVQDLKTALIQAGEAYSADAIEATSPRNVRASQPRRKQDIVYSPELLEMVLKSEARAISRFDYKEIPPSVLSDIYRT